MPRANASALSLELQAELHDCISRLAGCAWAFIALAYDDETVVDSIFPFREFMVGGELRQMPGDVIDRPTVFVGNFAAFREMSQRYSAIAAAADGRP